MALTLIICNSVVRGIIHITHANALRVTVRAQNIFSNTWRYVVC